MQKLKIVTFLFLLCFGGKLFAQDDTVGFWQITINGKEISGVNFNNEKTYFIDSLGDSDRVNVLYFNESPCKKCPCKLQFRDGDNHEIKTIERKGYGDNPPYKFTGAEIKQMMQNKKLYLFFDLKYDGWDPWIFMGALRRKEH
jgi:hypothetical protein